MIFKVIRSAKKGIELNFMISDAQISWKETVLSDFDFFIRFDVRYDMFDEIYQIFNNN